MLITSIYYAWLFGAGWAAAGHIKRLQPRTVGSIAFVFVLSLLWPFEVLYNVYVGMKGTHHE